jgi:hypothetical protein
MRKKPKGRVFPSRFQSRRVRQEGGKPASERPHTAHPPGDHDCEEDTKPEITGCVESFPDDLPEVKMGNCIQNKTTHERKNQHNGRPPDAGSEGGPGS